MFIVNKKMVVGLMFRVYKMMVGEIDVYSKQEDGGGIDV